MTLGELGNFAAYGFAPAVLVAPLGTVALISNAIIAPLFLGERFRTRDMIGIGLSIAGTLVSTSTSEPSLSQEDIVNALFQLSFVIYVIVSMGLFVFLVKLSNTEAGKQFIFIDLLIASIMGILKLTLGGYTVLSIKAVSSLLNLEFYNMFTHWVSYLMLFVLASTAVSQIHFLNKALSSFDSTQVIPTNFVLFTTSSIIGSSIMYHDLSRTNPIALLGVVSMFMGVFLITSKSEDQYSAIPDVEHHQTASQDWAAYNEWNRENNALWNPPSSWNSPTNASAQATSVPTGDLFNLNNPSQAIHIEDTPLLPNSLRSHSAVAPSITNSSPRRTPRRNSLYPPEDEFGQSPIDSTLKRLSSVMSSIGTHQIRKLEFDHMTDKTKFSKSPGSNL
ncbi:hypothetical protein HDV04_003577 [Boothiomyces sp. JEL0838]|nr:hypothetical protein HDV04_003577 [Boothiomyces sp. JEL0838]